MHGTMDLMVTLAFKNDLSIFSQWPGAVNEGILRNDVFHNGRRAVLPMWLYRNY